MQKIGNLTNTANPQGEFTDGSVAQGVSPTILLAAIFNTWQREMVGVVEGAGIALAPGNDGQLLQAIKALNEKSGAFYLRKNSNLTDVTDKAVALGALGGAPLSSPTFTGTPKGPTAAAGTNTTQLATTAYVQALAAFLAPLANPTFTGDPKAPTPAAGDNDTSIATTAFVQTAVTPFAVIRESTFTSSGSWTCPPGITSVYVDACAAGGGGAGGFGANVGAGGGGGGESVIGRALSVIPGTTYTITVGAGGLAGFNGSTSGGKGGDTQIVTLLALTGGGGGTTTSAGAAGGPGGRVGIQGYYFSGVSYGGSGGGSIFGGGGAGGSASMLGAQPIGFGAGGGAGAVQNGGTGAGGYVRIKW